MYLGLGFTTFGAAENYYAIDINITYKIGRCMEDKGDQDWRGFERREMWVLQTD